MKFEKTAEVKFGILRMKIGGFINEYADFGRHPFETISGVTLDCSSTELINSTGVLIWVNWFKEAAARNSKLEFTFSGCPKALIQQMNSVKYFLPANSHVQSFSIPMLCLACENSMSTVLLHGKDYTYDTAAKKYEVKIPKIECAKCKMPMEPDFLPGKYFQFLNLCVAK